MSKINQKVFIFADGSSRGNPGRGGYGAIVINSSHVKELGDGDKMTTNNKMELSAVIFALEYSEQNKENTGKEFIIYTDSKYVINGAKGWIFGWQKNGWKTTSKEAVKNQELWMKLADLISGKKIEWILLPGHAGVSGNERCDEIATSFADGEKIKLFDGKLADYNIKDILDIFNNPELIKQAKEDKKASGKSSSKSAIKAHSYVSRIGNVIHIDKTWAECEKRVKGTKGALYKKAVSLSDQENIIKDFKSR